MTVTTDNHIIEQNYLLSKCTVNVMCVCVSVHVRIYWKSTFISDVSLMFTYNTVCTMYYCFYKVVTLMQNKNFFAFTFKNNELNIGTPPVKI